MQLVVQGKNVEVSDWLQQYIQKKVAKFGRRLPGLHEARVELSMENARNAGERYVAQVTLRSNGTLLRAEDRSADMQTSIDTVLDKMVRQIDRYKGKRARGRVRVVETPEELAAEPEAESGALVRIKRFPVTAMTVEEALLFFADMPRIQRYLQTLADVGLGYIRLGQQATTLSGGEAQRVKLATELVKGGTGKTIYLLDEPTTGLHFEDIRMLLTVLNKLVDKGNTVIVIEHNLDVIKAADWIIDLGPEGGKEGGTIVATGTPEEIARAKNSYTGKYLKESLK